LLRAAIEHQSDSIAFSQSPQMIRRRTAIIAAAVLTLLGALGGAGAAELDARSSPGAPLRLGSALGAVPARVGTCPSDELNLFAILAPLPGDVAAQVVAQLSPRYAGAMGSLAAAMSPDALPPVPDSVTLAQLLARMGASERNAVLSARSPEQQAAVKAALLDTALVFMTYGVAPDCP
jgi:hypothetical protein